MAVPDDNYGPIIVNADKERRIIEYMRNMSPFYRGSRKHEILLAELAKVADLDTRARLKKVLEEVVRD